jgi:hypothetical protein
MDRQVADLVRLLDDSHAALRAAVDAVPADRRARTPTSGGWSVAEVLEHVALVDARFAQVVSEAIAQAETEGGEPGLGAPLDETLRARVADRREKRQSPEVSTPTGRLDSDAAWAALDEAHHRFRAMLQQTAGRTLGGVRAPHPRWGSLTVCQYAELLAGHEQRHAAQIREVGETLRSRD